ncbi:MAG: replication endonuclease [Arcobacteraceae bacterium]|nr:replication endonuclease [Arcobacteraceae bacterium]
MYGLSKQNLIFCQEKLDKQRKFLSDCKVQTSTGQIKSYLDFSHSANLSSRYYSELINKVNSIYSALKSQTQTSWQPTFITITLDGFFRDFLQGDFSRYNEFTHKEYIPNNERFGFLQDKIKDKIPFTLKDLYNVLNFQFNRFQMSQAYKKIKKKLGLHYIRVTEPHKNGVPHFHIMLYCPVQYVDLLRDTYKIYFPAKQNIRKLKKGSNDLLGFQTDIKNAPAYVLKYLFKSFIDVKNKTSLDYLQAWYIKHRIMRVVTSHTLIPAWVYRKMIPLEKDWCYLTYIKDTGIVEWSQEDNYIKFEDIKNQCTFEYDNGIYKRYYKDKVTKTFGIHKTNKIHIPQTFKLKYKKPYRNIPTIIDGTSYIWTKYKLIKQNSLLIVSKMKDLQLYRHFQKIDNDIENVNLHHYGLVKNELIKRNIIQDKILPINEYNTQFDNNEDNKLKNHMYQTGIFKLTSEIMKDITHKESK